MIIILLIFRTSLKALSAPSNLLVNELFLSQHNLFRSKYVSTTISDLVSLVWLPRKQRKIKGMENRGKEKELLDSYVSFVYGLKNLK